MAVNENAREVLSRSFQAPEDALLTLDETIRSILSRYADDVHDTRLRFGHSEVEIKNGWVKIYPYKDEDTEKIVALLRRYFSVRERTVLPNGSTSERDLYVLSKKRGQMSRFLSRFGDIGICEGTPDFLGAAL